MTARRHVAGFVQLASGRLLAPLVAVVTTPILAQTLGATGRGELSAITVPFLLAVTLATGGIPEAAAYFIARGDHSFHSIRVRTAVTALLAGCVVAFVLALLAGVLSGGNSQIAHRLMLLAIPIPLVTQIAVARGIAVGRQQFTRVRAEQILSATSSFLGVVGLALSARLTVDAAAAVVVGSQLLGGLAYFQSDRSDRSAKNTPLRRDDLFKYASKSWVGATAGVAVSRLDQSLLTALASTTQLGLYAVAVAISEIPLILSGAASLLVFSLDAADNDDRRVAQAARFATLLCVAISVPVCGTGSLWFPWAFGEDFGHAVPMALVLALAAVVGTPGSIAGSALAARSRNGLRSAGLVAMLIVNVALLFLLAPSLGGVGAAIATLAANLLATIWMSAWLFKATGILPTELIGFRRADLQLLTTLVRRARTTDQDSDDEATA